MTGSNGVGRCDQSKVETLVGDKCPRKEVDLMAGGREPIEEEEEDPNP